MNPRQRRGAVLLGVSVLGAIGVLVMLASFLADVRSQLGPTVTVVVASQDLPPHIPPDPSQLGTQEIPERWLPAFSLRDAGQIGDRVPATTVPAGTILSEAMLVPRPSILPGERELAILVDAETGVAGKLSPGSLVDIFATFGGDDDVPPSSRIVVQRAEVIEVGIPVAVDDEAVGPALSATERIPVTFRLSVTDARTLAFVESFATSVRLALRSPLDDVILPGDITVFAPAPDELGRTSDPAPPSVSGPATDDEPDPTGDEPDPEDDPSEDDGDDADPGDDEDPEDDG
jgi:pilus assembly protein CpaB